LEQNLPLKVAGKKIPTRYEIALLINHHGRYLVRRRVAAGFLGGMWEFPTLGLAADEDPEKKLSLLLSDFALSGSPEQVGSIQHIYSHFRLQSFAYCKKIEDFSHVSAGDNSWFSLDELKNIALHGAHKKVLQQLTGV
jgi:A/G-specific adenine glycosylase